VKRSYTTKELIEALHSNGQHEGVHLAGRAVGTHHDGGCGAANAYLGLHAGQTIAATYPAAVIGMAVLKAFKGSVLEENIARNAGTIGEGVAAGSDLHGCRHFLMAGCGRSFDYGARVLGKSTAPDVDMAACLACCSCRWCGAHWCEDPTLPFPESVAGVRDSKAGQREPMRRAISSGASESDADSIVSAMRGCLCLRRTRRSSCGSASWEKNVREARNAADLEMFCRPARCRTVAAPTVSPALIGVGYVIGAERPR